MEKELNGLGLSGQDSLFIETMVQFFYDDGLLELSLKMRRNIENIHTGHFLYLACVYGAKVAAVENVAITNNINSLCRQN